MYHIPFWDTCRQKSRVHTSYLCGTNDKPLHDSCQHYCTGFVKTQSPIQDGVELDSKDSLRKAVKSLFNKLYGKCMKYCTSNCTAYVLFTCTMYMYVATFSSGQYIHDDKARLPYSKTEEYGLKIDGLPTSCALKHPSSYGKSTLKSILDNRENLKLCGEEVRRMCTCTYMYMYAASIEYLCHKFYSSSLVIMQYMYRHESLNASVEVRLIYMHVWPTYTCTCHTDTLIGTYTYT